jgi:hypothetical protein
VRVLESVVAGCFGMPIPICPGVSLGAFGASGEGRTIELDRSTRGLRRSHPVHSKFPIVPEVECLLGATSGDLRFAFLVVLWLADQNVVS